MKRFRQICVALLVIGILFSVVSSGMIRPQAAELSNGVQNIVKRARQMTEIQWTPVKDITGWGGGITYKAGVTYKGLPYGQPVDADYVPWETSLNGFLDAVNNSGSKMYTASATYNKIAPYYSVDCSAFVSWAWGLSARQDTRSIANFATQISKTSYENAQVGDCLNKAGSHVVLITDITYDSSGKINSIEISESTTDSANSYCCKVTRYGSGGSHTLNQLVSKYFGDGYILYRSKTRDSVTYTHSCAVPLGDDQCNKCYVETDTSVEKTYFGIDVSHWQGTINWDAVAPNIDFAIIRCGYGDDLTDQDDSYWYANADACTRLGIPFGVYLMSYAVTDDQARSEAQHVLRLIEGYDPTLPIYLDLEDTKYILPNCSNADILRHAQIFCDILEDAGYTVGIYANHDWWTNYLTDSAYDQWSRWIARYASTTGYNKDYDMWQYSDSGSIPGISGNVDLNYWYGPLPSSHEHDYTSSVTGRPTCTQSGVRTYTCSCGDSYTESIAPTGHAYSGQQTRPTCTAAGYTTYTCGNCGDTYWDDEMGPLGHNYSAGYCTRCGAQDGMIIKGDLDGDGVIASTDSVLLARYLANLITLTEEQLLAADIDGDGYVSSADSVLVARFLAGLIDEI